MKEINLNRQAILFSCTNHHVEKLYLFGSAVKGDLNEKSDFDFLVKFSSFDLKDYFLNYMALKDELESILHRRVDLLEEQTINNPILKSSIDNSKQLIYG